MAEVGVDCFLDGARRASIAALNFFRSLRRFVSDGPLAKMGGTLDGQDVDEALPVGPAAGVRTHFGHGGCHWSAPSAARP
jgi:hypothetical protein